MRSLRRLWAVFVARNKEFLRDRGALAWNLMFPLFVVFGMSFAFSGRNQEVFKIGVIGETSALPPGFSATRFAMTVFGWCRSRTEARFRRCFVPSVIPWSCWSTG